MNPAFGINKSSLSLTPSYGIDNNLNNSNSGSKDLPVIGWSDHKKHKKGKGAKINDSFSINNENPVIPDTSETNNVDANANANVEEPMSPIKEKKEETGFYKLFPKTEHPSFTFTNDEPVKHIPELISFKPFSNSELNTTVLDESISKPTVVTSPKKSDPSEINWKNDYLVDPLSVIIKLALIGKKEINTKISIVNHSVQIHETGIFQGIARIYYKSSKFDIYYLHTPIKQACIHFLLKNPDVNNTTIKKIFTNAICGLEQLIATYKSCAIIGLCINNYIDIIKNSIDGNYDPTLYKEDDYSVFYTPDILNKLFEVWTPEKLQIVLNMNDYIYTDRTTFESIQSLETFMNGIDSDIKHILEKL